MTAGAPQLIAADLAPGDGRSRAFDWSGLRIERIRSARDPLFSGAYRRLWKEFGADGGMELAAVITSRLAWDPRRPIDGYGLRYELLAVLRGETMVAVRDHTVIVPGQPRAARAEIVVHLSHLLVEPPLRGSGLSGWLRAVPIQTARESAAAAGVPDGWRITLVAEMEHSDGVTPDVMARLRSYERAGFTKIDPARVRYCQPDFRAAEMIDRTGVRPLPFALIVRRIGRETEQRMSGAEARTLINALYTMYGAHVRADHMAPLWARMEQLPPADAPIALVAPTQ
jgi:GNAT superfamily N-acetyltransferase